MKKAVFLLACSLFLLAGCNNAEPIVDKEQSNSCVLEKIYLPGGRGAAIVCVDGLEFYYLSGDLPVWNPVIDYKAGNNTPKQCFCNK